MYNSSRFALAVTLVSTMTVGLAACASDQPVLSDDDRLALQQLSAIAQRDAGLPSSAADAVSADAASADEVACWVPSESLLRDEAAAADPDGVTDTAVPDELSRVSETTFRVICRVHFTEANATEDDVTGADVQRYRDMICIGDLGSDPVTDYCYQWAYYREMPSFEQQRAVTVP